MIPQFLAWDTGIGKVLQTALEKIFETLVSPLVAVLKVLLSILAEIIYFLISDTLINILYVLLRIVDFCEGIFNIFAGIEPVNAYGEEMYLLDAFISHNTIQNALVMITIVAVIVCFVFTLYSLGKSIGANIVENKKPVGHIMGQALKACIAFLLVPLMCYFGVQLSSTLLTSTSRAITTSMGSDEETPFSTVLFLSGTFGGDADDSYNEGARADYLSNKKSIYNRTDISRDFPMQEFDNHSNVFESMFAVDGSEPEAYQAGLGAYNYILVYCEAIFTIIVMLCSVLVFIRRIIEVILLYIVSPFFVASIPLDEGATFKRWREMFIGKLISGFGTVFTMKIVLLLVPVFMKSSFKFADDMMVDAIIKTLFAVGSILAAYKSQHTILEAFNPEIAHAAKESAGAVMALGAAAVKVGVQAASAVATGGASAAASAAGGLAGAAGAAGSAAGAAGAAGGMAGAAGGLGGAAGGLGGAGGAAGGLGGAGGGAFTGGGSAGGLNTGGASAGGSGGSSGGSGGSKGGGIGDTLNKISDMKDKMPSSGDKDKKDESQEYKG